MRNLLKANFYKIIKERGLFILLTIAIITAILNILISNAMKEVMLGGAFVFEAMLANGVQLAGTNGFIFAIAMAMYIGKDFSQNTIRNKIIIGHSKTSIYIANLISCIIICIAMYAVYLMTVFGLALPLFGVGTMGSSDILRLIAISFMIIVSFCAFTNMISMLTKSIVAGIMVNIVLLIAFATLFSVLHQISFSGTTKSVIDFILKSNFYGQSVILLSTNTRSFLIAVTISSVLLSAGCTLLGSKLFSRSDLK